MVFIFISLQLYNNISIFGLSNGIIIGVLIDFFSILCYNYMSWWLLIIGGYENGY